MRLGLPSTNHPNHRRIGVWVVAAFSAVLLAGGIGYLHVRATRSRTTWPAWWIFGERTAANPRPTRVAAYVGSEACLQCHPAESALFGRSGHRRTLTRALKSPAAARLAGNTVKDPERADVTWSYKAQDGKLTAERAVGGKIESMVLDYALGSGKHGVTFVSIENSPGSERNPTGIEHRISYFSDGDRLDITPGQQAIDHRLPELETLGFGQRLVGARLRQCIGCHATATSTHGENELDVPTLIVNISCERCHGPAEFHVKAARRGENDLEMRFGIERVQSRVEVSFCGECHGTPQPVPSSTITPDNPLVVRFQAAGLAKSRCYAGGLGALRCTSCHDPHDKASSNRAAYSLVCLSCHRIGSTQTSCPVSPADNCIGCHMPRRAVPPSGLYTDHWIRRNIPARKTPGSKSAT
jgi:hypothetical protein